MSQKLNVAVIFGGASSEYEVSCKSAANVISILDLEKYNIYKLGVTKDGRWLLTTASTDDIRSDNWQAGAIPAVISPDSTTHGILCDSVSVRIDVAFPIIHGKNGEDGAIAGLLQLANIPQVTTTMTSAANGMDKVITKILCQRAGIKVSDFEYFYAHELKKDPTYAIKKIESRFDYPVFVKPSSAGSSVGVTKCTDRDSLIAGLALAGAHDFKVLVEEAIDGVEVEAAVIGNFEPRCDVCGQIAAADEFYSYDAKYNNAESRVFIPAKIDKDLQKQVCEQAIIIYKTMECQGMSRVDFFVTKSGDIIFNEINTTPGFTDISMYPKMMDYCGLSGFALADELITLALSEDRI